jgi:peptidoglycan hydrolase CwlO-like protein
MVIAYLGDILGKRIGKKRISLFGLRPRTTAMLVTIIIGAVISIVTFLLLITFSSQMRQMLLRTEQMQDKIQEMKLERNELQDEVGNLKGEVTQLGDQIMTAVSQRDEIKIQSDGYREDLELLGDEIIDKQGQLDELAQNQIQLETTINNLEDQLKTSDEQYAAAEKNLNELKTQLDDTAVEIEFVKTEITYLETEKQKKENQITGLENRITNLNSEITGLHSAISRMQTEDIAFFEGQRLYGFTINNDLLIKQITHAVEQSFRNFESGDEIYNLGCSIKEPSSEELYSIIEKVNSSSADESIILVFSARNVFRGDKIPVNFHVYDQYVVFNSGSLIIEQSVERKLNLFEARDLAAKMIHDACSKALDRGLLQDPFGQVSNIAPQTLNEIAKKIVKHRRPMKVKLIAQKDIYRGVYLDESNLQFSITDD